MIQTKIFSDDYYQQFQDDINMFLLEKKISKESLIDVKFAESSHCWSALIIYEEK